MAGDFEDPSIAGWPVELDIFEDIDTVAAALVDQGVGLTAAVVELVQHSEVQLDKDQDFDLMLGMVIVLEMHSPVEQSKIIVITPIYLRLHNHFETCSRDFLNRFCINFLNLAIKSSRQTY